MSLPSIFHMIVIYKTTAAFSITLICLGAVAGFLISEPTFFGSSPKRVNACQSSVAYTPALVPRGVAFRPHGNNDQVHHTLFGPKIISLCVKCVELRCALSSDCVLAVGVRQCEFAQSSEYLTTKISNDTSKLH